MLVHTEKRFYTTHVSVLIAFFSLGFLLSIHFVFRYSNTCTHSYVSFRIHSVFIHSASAIFWWNVLSLY